MVCTSQIAEMAKLYRRKLMESFRRFTSLSSGQLALRQRGLARRASFTAVQTLMFDGAHEPGRTIPVAKLYHFDTDHDRLFRKASATRSRAET
jgi:hypothetical protein